MKFKSVFLRKCYWNVAEKHDELERRLKKGLEYKGLTVNMEKTKITCSRHIALKTEIKSWKFPCAVCVAGVEVNLITDF